jgi:hypothetical protein
MVGYDNNAGWAAEMTSGTLFLISFMSIMAGIVFGTALRTRLPGAHLSPETKEVIRLGAGLLATLAAVVISLMIASAKTSYDAQDAHFRQLSADVVLTDQLLAQYGPEATAVRKLMRLAVPAAVERIWREKATGTPQSNAFTVNSVTEQIYAAIESLTPVNEVQRSLKARIVEASTGIGHARLLLFADSDKPIFTPFLLILIVWLTVIFTSFSLFVEPGALVLTALLVFALSVSSALFLVADLSQPFAGLMQISKDPLVHALAPLG